MTCGYVSCAAACAESVCSMLTSGADRVAPVVNQQFMPSCATSRLNERHDLRFADLHKKVMTFNTDARPFRRCLVFQARFAAKQALAEGRFNEEQLAEMKPYLVAVSLQASHIQVREVCCGLQLMLNAGKGTPCKIDILAASVASMPGSVKGCNLCSLADVLAEDAR